MVESDDWRRLGTVLAALGLGLLAVRRLRGGGESDTDGAGTEEAPSDEELDDIAEQIEDHMTEFSVDVDEDIEAAIEAVETDGEATVDDIDIDDDLGGVDTGDVDLDEDEPSGGEIDPTDLRVPDDEQFNEFIEDVLGDDDTLPSGGLREAISERFAEAEVDESAYDGIELSDDDEAAPTAADSNLDIVDYLAVAVAGLEAAREAYVERREA